MKMIDKVEKGKRQRNIDNLSGMIDKAYKLYQSKMDDLSEVVIVQCKDCKHLFLKRPVNPNTLFCSIFVLGPWGPIFYWSNKKSQFCPNCSSSNFEVAYEEMQKQRDLPAKETEFRYASIEGLSDTPYVQQALFEGETVIFVYGVLAGLAGILALWYGPWSPPIKIFGIFAIVHSYSVFYLLKRMKLYNAERMGKF